MSRSVRFRAVALILLVSVAHATEGPEEDMLPLNPAAGGTMSNFTIGDPLVDRTVDQGENIGFQGTGLTVFVTSAGSNHTVTYSTDSPDADFLDTMDTPSLTIGGLIQDTDGDTTITTDVLGYEDGSAAPLFLHGIREYPVTDGAIKTYSVAGNDLRWASLGGDISGQVDLITVDDVQDATADTESAGDNSTQVATTAYVDAAAAGPQVLLDGVNHTDTAASTVVRGDIMIGNSTPAWERLGIGALGEVLAATGTDPVWVPITLPEIWIASAMSVDGTQCLQPAEETINSGPKVWSITCDPAANTDGTIYGNVTLGANFTSDGALRWEITGYILSDNGLGTFYGNIAIQCQDVGGLIDSNWDDAVELDIELLDADSQYDVVQGFITGFDTATESCSPGDTLFWKYVVCADDATPTTGCSDANGFEDDVVILSMRMRQP